VQEFLKIIYKYIGRSLYLWSLLVFNVQFSVYAYYSRAGHCVVKELTKLEGEASANNRKAKLFFFYEWELTASWKGTSLYFTLVQLLLAYFDNFDVHTSDV